MPLQKKEDSLPQQSELIVWAEFIELTGCAESRLTELMDMGWLEPTRTAEVNLFHQKDVYRLRKLDRLCHDFEFSSLAGAMIVDLLERIDNLERRLKQYENL